MHSHGCTQTRWSQESFSLVRICSGSHLGLSSWRTGFRSQQATNSIGNFGNVTFPLWASISPFKKWWVGIRGCSFQLWHFIIYESCLLLHPISVVLKAHFFSFSAVRMIDSFTLSNFITYFYIFVGYYVCLPSFPHEWTVQVIFIFGSPTFIFHYFLLWLLFEYYFLKPMRLRIKALDLDGLGLKSPAQGEMLDRSLNTVKYSYV